MAENRTIVDELRFGCPFQKEGIAEYDVPKAERVMIRAADILEKMNLQNTFVIVYADLSFPRDSQLHFDKEMADAECADINKQARQKMQVISVGDLIDRTRSQAFLRAEGMYRIPGREY